MDILKALKNLDINKVYGHESLSVRIIKLSGLICKALELIFRECLKERRFSSSWKKSNIVPIYKKNEKNLIIKYRPVSLLPVCSKIFERLIYNSIVISL